ncbi:SRPBCC family protein [Gordonia sp. NPDC003424]
MRYRDQPTIEVAEKFDADPATVWDLVTDITLPTRFSAELQRVEWLDGADHLEVGARFRGHNHHPALGDWQTECRVVEFEPPTRWVYEVSAAEPFATWGFEVDPERDGGATVRQWARMGPGPSGLTPAIERMPEKEGRIIARRLREWEQGMRANLAGLREMLGH